VEKRVACNAGSYSLSIGFVGAGIAGDSDTDSKTIWAGIAGDSDADSKTIWPGIAGDSDADSKTIWPGIAGDSDADSKTVGACIAGDSDADSKTVGACIAGDTRLTCDCNESVCVVPGAAMHEIRIRQREKQQCEDRHQRPAEINAGTRVSEQ